MLIATLPTLVSDRSIELSEKILSHPLIGAVRYNTGGDSPHSPKEILEKLKPIADRNKKTLYVDLEGRQLRIANWTPHNSGSVKLNRDFEIELPGKIFFRGAGWFEIVDVDTEKRKVFFERNGRFRNYYFGESQSAHIVAKNFEVKGYLGGLDREYISAARDLGIYNFMLSFVENQSDLEEFEKCYHSTGVLVYPKVVAKIESRAGVEYLRKFSNPIYADFLKFMAARDDLFLSFVDHKEDFLDALKLIVKKDPNAILASHIMSGIESDGEVSVGNISDIALMSKFGYKHFMLSDGMAGVFTEAMLNWGNLFLKMVQK